MGRSKYNSKPTEVDGITFASKGEARRYAELKLLDKAGEIQRLELQVSFPLLVNGIKVGSYIADFTYIEKGKEIIEDFKGVLTPIFKLKWKIVQAMFAEDKNKVFRVTR